MSPEYVRRLSAPTSTFSDENDAIIISFRNASSTQLRGDINVRAVEVGGWDRNATFWSGWVDLPAGSRYSMPLEAPPSGLIAGLYSLDLALGGQFDSAAFTVQSSQPLALFEEDVQIEAGANVALRAPGDCAPSNDWARLLATLGVPS